MKLGKITKKRKFFYTTPTLLYTLYPYDDFLHCNEDFQNFNDAEQLV